MSRAVSPEIVTGSRGPRGPETVTRVAEPAEFRPQVTKEAPDQGAHFVSRYREYAIVIATEPDHVTAAGEIVKGLNKHVRFQDFGLITTDQQVIEKIRRLKEYGLGRIVWEKYQQDQELAQQSMEAAEAAIAALPPEMQQKLVGQLVASVKTFDMPQVAAPAIKQEPQGDSPGAEESAEIADLLRREQGGAES